MRTLALTPLTLIALAAASCSSAPSHSGSSSLGLSAMEQDRAAAVAAELEDFMAEANAAKADLLVPEEIVAGGPAKEKTEGVVVAQGGGRKYRVFFAGLTNSQKGRVAYRNDDPEVEVQAGFGYAWGWRPFITTDRVTTATDGTKVLVQIDPGSNTFDPADDIHRVFLMSPGKVDVVVRAELEPCNHLAQRLTDAWTYVECVQQAGDNGPCMELSDIKDIADAPKEVREFVRRVLKSQRLKRLSDD